MPLTTASALFRATYRVQLHKGFNFRDLAEQVGFLKSLGISDLYLSPIFAAAPGSLHGYDVNDYTAVNEELGGEAGLAALDKAVRAEGLGILLDMVPNHMGVAGAFNPWWKDVLENGEHSYYAPFFDIQWNLSGSDKSRHRVLVPMLHDHYGKVLEEGRIAIELRDGFYLNYGDVLLPTAPRTYGSVLRLLEGEPSLSAQQLAEAAALARSFSTLPQPNAAENHDGARQREARVAELKHRFSAWLAGNPDIRAQVEERLRRINGKVGQPGSFDLLHQILEEQHYRLARWKTGAHEINYRRFFAIDSLMGVRMENPEVFAESHRLIARLVAQGTVSGLRIDHIDGLRQPLEYLQRLQAFPRPDPEKPLYVLVEKILGTDEALPSAWPVHGTTGYEFIPHLAGVLVNAGAERQFNQSYHRFTGEGTDYATVLYSKKRLILEELFANAVTILGSELADITDLDRRWQDMTSHELAVAIREIMAFLTIYRTYRSSEAPLEGGQRRVMEEVCAAAIRHNHRLEREPFEFVRDVIVGDYPPPSAPPELRGRVLAWVLTFQQYSGAVMAKSAEDTAFYTYCRFIALNEVGSDPSRFGGTVEQFHRRNAAWLTEGPLGLLTTSTHDTKLSEDVRARLYALSELAEEWDKWIDRWHDLNVEHLSTVDGHHAPDRIDEYRFYQVLIGAWPLENDGVNDEFRGRLKEHFRKAVNEAKRHTSALQPNEPYLAACERFVDAVTSSERSAAFLEAFAPCARRIAHIGLTNSLVQLILKCTCPGVPDFYQGQEAWDFSLVDPDNRRSVDYPLRHQLFRDAMHRPMPELLEHWRDGRIKTRVMQTLLQFRSAHAPLFVRGTYTPVLAVGTFSERVVAYTREHEGRSLLVVVPRLTSPLGAPPVGLVWDDTVLNAAPSGVTQWRDLFTNRVYPANEPLRLKDLLSEVPFGVLTNLN